MVCPNFNRFRVAFKIMAKLFQGKNDGQEFFVMNFVVAFCGLERLGEVSNQMPSI
jgi:hypothetical protein